MRKIKVNKELTIFATLVVIIIAELLFGLPMTIANISNLNGKIKKMRQELSTVQKEWPRKEEYLKRKEALETEIITLESKYIPAAQASSFLSFISSEAKNYNIEILTLRPGKPSNYAKSSLGQFNYLPIDIEAKGNFHNLALFLNALNSSKYFFEITNLNISYGYPYNSVGMTICGLEKE
ncbi:MAG: type 4a pilus biogenesis protein PilO [Candidatus Omnitrophica bacterium]|nr:type 4a pilus biogenesis protein PilO [Candidatus Omnitrophota bacterium]